MGIILVVLFCYSKDLKYVHCPTLYIKLNFNCKIILAFPAKQKGRMRGYEFLLYKKKLASFLWRVEQ